MGRPEGAKNKSSRENRAEAKRLTEKAKFQDKMADLKKEAKKK